MAKERIYPFAVASVRSMENKLLTKQKLLQMAEAKDAEEALRFLQDSDYGKTQIGDVHEFETMIQANLEEAYQAMGKLIPNEVFMDIFRFKNDYHNVKVLIKEEISKVNGRKFLIQGGSIPVEDLRKFFRPALMRRLWKKPLSFMQRQRTDDTSIRLWIEHAFA